MDNLEQILSEIRAKLRNNRYQNEEHVRLSLVARVVQALGWDIWNPAEVNAEYSVAPDEDYTKVDLALFSNDTYPAVFIEIKAVGKLESNLQKVEQQVRDYNRNITAPFSIITDGEIWRFYYVKGEGSFAQKLFDKVVLSDSSNVANAKKLNTYLARDSVRSGEAEETAKRLLNVTQKQDAMSSSYSKAEDLTRKEPFPTLPDAIVKVMKRKGFDITKDEAVAFISSGTITVPLSAPSYSDHSPQNVNESKKTQPSPFESSTKKASTKEIYDSVILVLQENGGKLGHNDIFDAVYKKLSNYFSQPWYKETLSDGKTIRWENMVGWKFTDGRKAGLIKPSEMSKPKYCELTEKGMSYKPES